MFFQHREKKKRKGCEILGRMRGFVHIAVRRAGLRFGHEGCGRGVFRHPEIIKATAHGAVKLAHLAVANSINLLAGLS
jgi:hypothetical protein